MTKITKIKRIDLLKKISETSYPSKIVICDFNYRDIDCNNISAITNENRIDKEKYIEGIKDCYKYQHVNLRPSANDEGLKSDIQKLILFRGKQPQCINHRETTP